MEAKDWHCGYWLSEQGWLFRFTNPPVFVVGVLHNLLENFGFCLEVGRWEFSNICIYNVDSFVNFDKCH